MLSRLRSGKLPKGVPLGENESLANVTRMVVFYPMSAILTIFCNLLLDPLNAKAGEDMELLQSVPKLIEGMRNRRLTAYEVAHVKMIDEFVLELTRLGTSAIAKAKREQLAN